MTAEEMMDIIRDTLKELGKKLDREESKPEWGEGHTIAMAEWHTIL